jgi:hypothetical protein
MTNRDELERVYRKKDKIRQDLEGKLGRIKYQIDLAKARKEETGERSDRNWFARAKAALRVNGAKHQQVLRDIKELKKVLYSRNWEKHFVDIARDYLDNETFLSLIEEAKKREETFNQRQAIERELIKPLVTSN